MWILRFLGLRNVEDEKIKRQKLGLNEALTLLIGERELLNHSNTFIYALKTMMSVSTLLLTNLFAWLAWVPAFLELKQLVYVTCFRLCVFSAGPALTPHMRSISSFNSTLNICKVQIHRHS